MANFSPLSLGNNFDMTEKYLGIVLNHDLTVKKYKYGGLFGILRNNILDTGSYYYYRPLTDSEFKLNVSLTEDQRKKGFYEYKLRQMGKSVAF